MTDFQGVLFCIGYVVVLVLTIVVTLWAVRPR